MRLSTTKIGRFKMNCWKIQRVTCGKVDSKLLTVVFILTIQFHVLSISHSKSIIETLPGYPGNLPFKLETGYVGTGEKEDVQLFYYFVESSTRNPFQDPLIFYISGGPGASALLAFLYEIVSEELEDGSDEEVEDERVSDVEGNDGEGDSDKEDEADESNESVEVVKDVKTKVVKGKKKFVFWTSLDVDALIGCSLATSLVVACLVAAAAVVAPSPTPQNVLFRNHFNITVLQNTEYMLT
ncbi:putative peptidase S10, serine carboxypeptidase, alpha/beta hydrolase fold protein [Tanacetum coccineum]